MLTQAGYSTKPKSTLASLTSGEDCITMSDKGHASTVVDKSHILIKNMDIGG
jgi:hypothetical protein